LSKPAREQLEATSLRAVVGLPMAPKRLNRVQY
jgi:hypothetical protein